ncbi:MAG: tRNA pseudouridine synthase A [Planctomycetota bacterium]|nr:tRNA pseudouridine synthase A [Planctomycetota bacterium]
MPRYRLTIAYDGTDFCGWQKQELFLPPPDARPADQRPPDRETTTPVPRPGKLAGATTLDIRDGEDRPRTALRTVQHVVEQSVRAIVREDVILTGASRTDTGVHAKGQVAAFTCSPADVPPRRDRAADFDSSLLPPEPEEPPGPSTPRGPGWPLDRGTGRLLRAINSRLPDDILVVACEPTSPDFDPIQHATSKAYSYTLHVGPPPPHGLGLRPLWDRRYVHHVWEPLDLDRMERATAHLVGEHDFAAFAAAGHGRLSTVRTILSCTVTELSPVTESRRLRIDVSGTGFLWNMVRILAGTLVDVGRARIDPDAVPAIIASRDRRAAGPTLPPTGLCLEWIRY